MTKQTAEHTRLATSFPPGEGWKKWGPYLSERRAGALSPIEDSLLWPRPS
jgi:hypothetical protein